MGDYSPDFGCGSCYKSQTIQLGANLSQCGFCALHVAKLTQMRRTSGILLARGSCNLSEGSDLADSQIAYLYATTPLFNAVLVLVQARIVAPQMPFESSKP